MSRLRLDDALAYNPAAPWLYFGFWVLMLASGSVLGRVAMEWRLRPSGAQSA